MDSIFYGFAKLMEWMFKLIQPVGGFMDLVFVVVISIGAIYWLWYDVYVTKSKDNYMAEKGK